MTANRSAPRIPIWVGQIGCIVAFGLIWQALYGFGLVNPLFIGNPRDIGIFLYKGLFDNGEIWVHLEWTMAATLVSFVLGSTGGVLAGLLFVTYPRVEEFLDPILSALNALPRIALAPLFLLWFGLGIWSKIAVGTSLTFFIVLGGTIAGARAINADHITLARTLGARPSQIFRQITLPGAVPTVFSGLRLGLIYALLGVVGAEIIAAQRGLGQMLTFLAGTFQTNGMFAILVLLAIIGAGLTWLMTIVEMRLLRWR